MTSPPASKLFPDTWRPASLQEILHREYEPPPWVIEDLLPKQSGLLCSGLPHACKSLNWLAAALESVVTHKVWGKFNADQVRRVLYVETEDPRWLIEDRIRGLACGLGLSPKDDLADLGFGLAVTGPFNLKMVHSQLFALVDAWKPDWIVLSTLQGLLQGLDWKEQKDMGEPNAILVKLQRLCPCVVVTHSPRDGARRSAGTVTQDANYLTLMHFEKQIRFGKTYINVEGDSKMGTELLFDLRLDIAEITDGNRSRTQVRNVVYEYENLSKKERVIAAIARHPTADAGAIALMCDCSERYVRDLLREAKLKGGQLV